MKDQELIKVVLIGYGHLGKWHAQKVESTNLAKLVGIVEPNEENRNSAKEKFPQAKIVNFLSEIINEVDAGVIATPTTLHFQYIEELIQQNKHVFCEKPVCASQKELNALRLLEEKYPQLVLQVGQSERLHAAFELIRKEEKVLSSPSTLVINRMAPFHKRALDVDVTTDLMIHDIDLALHLFNELPIEVYATGHKNRSKRWDAVYADFRFKSGNRAFIRSQRNFVKQVRELELTNNYGTYYVDMMVNELSMVMPPQEKNIEEGTSPVEKIHYEKRDHLFIEHQTFYQAIRKERENFVPFREGLNSYQIVLATEEALDKGQWVKIQL